MTRKERKQWLNGRKVHGVLDNKIACRPSYSLAAGWAFTDMADLREVTCSLCRKIMKTARLI